MTGEKICFLCSEIVKAEWHLAIVEFQDTKNLSFVLRKAFYDDIFISSP